MQTTTSFVNIFLAVLTVFTNAFSIALVTAFFLKAVRQAPIIQFLVHKSLWVSFVASLIAMLGSLTYSDIIGYDPCKMCWLQRIFMYPLVPIFGIALIRKDAWIRIYGIVFSVIGMVIAFYHYIIQLGWNPLDLECGAIGYSASCAKTFVLQFGYITIPFMAFSVFVFIALVLGLSFKEDKEKGK